MLSGRPGQDCNVEDNPVSDDPKDANLVLNCSVNVLEPYISMTLQVLLGCPRLIDA